MTDGNCNYVKDSDGEPCGRPAGWGTDSDIGHCRDHREEFQVPRKMDEETVSTLVGAAQQGAFKRDCAHVAGITPQTLRNWLNAGEEHREADLDTPYADFYLRFQRARGAGAVSRLRNADGEFVLERSYGYTKTERHEHLVDDEADLGGDLPEEEREAIREALASRRR